MKKPFYLIFLLLSLCASAEEVQEITSLKGKIFRINSAQNRFQLLQETVYDPKTDEGVSNVACVWNSDTRFIEAFIHSNFDKISKPRYANFNPKHAEQAVLMASGKSFSTNTVSFEEGLEDHLGLSKDKKKFVALFTPDKGNSSKGSIFYKGKNVSVQLRPSNRKVITYSECKADKLNEGLWLADLRGKMKGEKFVCNEITITSFPDPRKTDDPDLPRVLVIGDSISMNYHDAAKSALKGVANYHRIEGNGGPSNRGATCVELWLGDYKQKGLQWDVIQFNHGLHDLKQPYDKGKKSWGKHQVSIEDYKKNLNRVIFQLKKTGAKLIWCSTTPVANSGKGLYARKKGESAVFNKAALEVLKKHPKIQINDLHSKIISSPVFDNWKKGSNVHFYKKEEREFIGKVVAEAVKSAL